MPSSTSSFKRVVPSGSWPVKFIAAHVVGFAVLLVWELNVRSQGYAPTLNDTADLWAQTRTELAEAEGKPLAVIGSSRIHFDLNLELFAEKLGVEKPYQLAMPGANALVVLEHLANDEEFKGDILAGIVPGLYFAPEGMPIDRPTKAIKRYENWVLFEKFGNFAKQKLESRFAFLQQEDLTLEALLGRIPVGNRPDAMLPPQLPPYFYALDGDRQATMWSNAEFGTPLAQRIQQIWMPLFTPPPPPLGMSMEDFMGLFMKSVESYMQRTEAAMAKLRGKGSKVIFVRAPSSGGVRELENKFSPRPPFWDQLTARAGVTAIHFEDHPSLANFECPEWSHLTGEDAKRFTVALAEIIQREAPGFGKP